MAVLGLMLAMVLSVTKNIGASVQHASSKMDAFASARAGFNIMTQKLSQAVLNTYWDYYDASGARRDPLNADAFIAANYGRASDLQFVIVKNSQSSDYGQAVFFQAPEGNASQAGYRSVQGLLNACGFYVQYGSDDVFRPAAIARSQWRFRLMQGGQPTESLQIFSGTSSFKDYGIAWTGAVSPLAPGSATVTAAATPLADNVIALVVWPRLSAVTGTTGTQLTANYQYDSQLNANTTPQPVTAHQLPPCLQVTMVTIDEASAARLDTGSDTPPADISAALSGKFKDVARYQSDLDELASMLTSRHITFQILTTSILLQESKWSVTP